MGPTWGPSGADRTQVGPMLAPWTLLSGKPCFPYQLDDTIMCHPLILFHPHWWHHDVSLRTAPVIPIYWCVGRLSACCLLRGLPVPHLRVVNTSCMHNWPLSTTDSPGCQDNWGPLKHKNHLPKYRDSQWRCHQMETFSAILVICAGNSPVPGEFPAQRPVTRSFDVCFDLRLNKRLSKQLWGWWFETLSCEPSYLNNGFSCTGITISLYWNGHLVAFY